MDRETREWLDELDDKLGKIATGIALLEQKQDHQYVTVNRQSDDRLAIINDRFTRLEARLAAHKEEDEREHQKLLTRAGAFLVAIATAVWFTVVEPVRMDIATIERRLGHVEANMLVSDATADAE